MMKVLGADVGSGVQIFRRPIIYHFDNLRVGDSVSINDNFWCNARGGVSIGRNTIIGPNVVIHSANHRYADESTTIASQGHDLKAVRIGGNVWIGANVIILPGVETVDRVVIAAGSVVSKSLLEAGVYAGVPAKKIKDI